MHSKQYLGWPVLSANTCFESIRSLDIKPWSKLAEAIPLTTFLETATPSERADYDRFAPKTYAIKHQNPYDGKTFDGFTTHFKPYACVFALIKDEDGNEYVPVTAEWKHGNDRITIVPICGVPNKAEIALNSMAETMHATGLREWKEETGTELENLIPLSSSNGVWSTVRNSHVQCFPYLGIMKKTMIKGPTKFDSTEHLAMILFPLNEWVTLIESDKLWEDNPGFAIESCARDVTYAALRKLGRLSLS